MILNLEGGRTVQLPGMPVGAIRTIANLGPNTVYYAPYSFVSDSNNVGSLVPGASATLSIRPTYIVSSAGESQVYDDGGVIPTGTTGSGITSGDVSVTSGVAVVNTVQGGKTPAAYSGLPADKQVLSWSQGIGAWLLSSLSGANVFGDGSNGSVTLDGIATVPWATLVSNVYTMISDCYLTGLTVDSPVVLLTRGFRVFVNGILLINAGAIVGGVGTNASGTNNSTAGGNTNTGTIQGGQAGGNGTATTGATGTKGTVGSGASGGASGGNSGGAQQVGFLSSAQAAQLIKTPFQVLAGQWAFGSTTVRLFQGGSGGSGGGGDATNAGGGGGSGGPLVELFATSIVNNGTIQAKGGNGGSPSTGNCGGGGAGSGGWVITFSLSPITGSGSFDVSPGANGTPSGTGSAPVSAATPGVSSSVVLV